MEEVRLFQQLIKKKLIDELYLLFNPVVLGRGDSIFSQVENFEQLTLVKSMVYPSGIVMLNYELK